MQLRYMALAIFCFSLPNLLVSTPPAGFETVDREITISTLVAQMKYDLPSFSVKPGEKVKIILLKVSSCKEISKIEMEEPIQLKY